MDTIEKLKSLLNGMIDPQENEDKEKLQNLQPDDNFIAELGLSSIDALQLLTLVEDHFGIFIEDDEISAGLFNSLSSLRQFIETKI